MPRETQSSPQRNILLTVGCVVVFLGALDTYVIASVIDLILDSLNFPLNKAPAATPAITAYLLGYTVALPLFGQISDSIGRKPVIQISLVVFAVGSTITAMATTFITLVIGRGIQGMAAGALLPVTMALVADLWHARKRTAVLGFVGGAQELGSLLGPIYGVLIVLWLHSWRHIFWLNLPLAFISLLLVQWGIPAHGPQRKMGRMDITGSVLLGIAISGIVIGFYNPSNKGETILAPHGTQYLLLSLLAAVGFIIWELRTRSPLLDRVKLVKIPFISAQLVSFVVGSALMITMVDVELYTRTIGDLPQKKAIWILSAFLLAVPLGAVLGGFAARYIGSIWRGIPSSNAANSIVTIAGLGVAALGFYFISHWPMDFLTLHFNWHVWHPLRADVDLFIAGLGVGTVIAPIAATSLASVNPQDHGMASAITVLARTIGMLVGASVLSAWGFHRLHILFEEHKKHIPPDVSDPQTQAAFVQYVKIIKKALISSAHTEYNEIFAITAVLCLVGAVLALGMSATRSRSKQPASEASL